MTAAIPTPEHNPTFTCPSGHAFKKGADFAPECHQCGTVATHWNGKTGEVYQWSGREDYDCDVRNMNEQLDQAFDNEHFK